MYRPGEVPADHCPNCLQPFGSEEGEGQRFEFYYCSRGDKAAHNPPPAGSPPALAGGLA